MYIEFIFISPGRWIPSRRWVLFRMSWGTVFRSDSEFWWLVIDDWGITCDKAPRSLGLTDDKLTLVQAIACCHQATQFYLSQCWPRHHWITITWFIGKSLSFLQVHKGQGSPNPRSGVSSVRQWQHLLWPRCHAAPRPPFLGLQQRWVSKLVLYRPCDQEHCT